MPEAALLTGARRVRIPARAGILTLALGAILGMPAPADAHPFGAPPIAELRVEAGTVTLTWTAARDDLAALAGHLGVRASTQEFAIRPDGTTERVAGTDEVDALAGRPEVDAYLRAHLTVEGCAVDRTSVADPGRGLAIRWRCPTGMTTVRLRSSMLTDIHPSYRTLVRAPGLHPSTAALTLQSPDAVFESVPVAAGQRSAPGPGRGLDARVLDAASTVRWPVLVVVLLAGLLHGLRPGHGKTVTAGYLMARGARARSSWRVALAVAATHSVTAAGLALAVWLAGDATGSTRTVTGRAQLIAAIVAVVAGLVLVTRFHRRPGHHHYHPHSGTGWTTAVSATVAGLVPSPTAFVACATAFYAGHPAWGLLLVVTFGIGLALGVAGLSGAIVTVADAVTRRAGTDALPRAQRIAQGVGAWLALGGGTVLLGSALVAR